MSVLSEGTASNVFGLVWLDDNGEQQMSTWGQVPPSWASR